MYDAWPDLAGYLLGLHGRFEGCKVRFICTYDAPWEGQMTYEKTSYEWIGEPRKRRRMEPASPCTSPRRAG